MTLFPKSTKFAKSASFHFSILVLLTKAHSDHLKKDSVAYFGSKEHHYFLTASFFLNFLFYRPAKCCHFSIITTEKETSKLQFLKIAQLFCFLSYIADFGTKLLRIMSIIQIKYQKLPIYKRKNGFRVPSISVMNFANYKCSMKCFIPAI